MKNIIDTFNKRGFKAQYFENSKDAIAFLLAEIQGTSVGFGGSMTTQALKLVELLGEKNEVYSHTTMGKEALAHARNSEVYISSANAITKTGEIINIDALGNRVSATIYGANRVFFICGTNKIADDLHSGIDRAKNIAAPKNAQRLNRKTPCAKNADKCYKCASPEKICRVMSIMSYPVTSASEIHLILINEELGY